MKENNKKKVVLGLSGGVDSSVALYLLLKQGYEVIPVFMRNWDSATNFDILGNPTVNDEICPQEKDYQDALKVCKQLNVELKRVDFVKEYWDRVFTYFLDEYKKNRTPNPDVLCNNEIKFKAFLDYALTLGADYIAMGHYARVKRDENGNNVLLKGIDQNKDQTYFLCQLTQSQLNMALFPIGDLEKTEVREIAHQLGLYTMDKKDSTGICFIGERNFSNFLKNYLPAKPGNIVLIDKTVVKQHTGLINYTIGQRKGLGIGTVNNIPGPWFVVEKDVLRNELIIASEKDLIYLKSNNSYCSNLVFRAEKKDGNYYVKFRYRQKDIPCYIKFLPDNKIHIKYQDFDAVTPGQFACIYKDDVCLGGAVIDDVYYDLEKRA